METLKPKSSQELSRFIKYTDLESFKIDMSENIGIINIDKESLTITLKTGTTWNQLFSHLKKSGYETCIYPKNDKLTLEEWLQTDGLNLAGFKFGPTGRSLYDIEIVTYDGNILNTGFKTTSYDALGYELKRIFLGSQRTLGLSTECTLQIRPKPEDQKAIKLRFSPETNFKDVIDKINKKSLIPTLMFLTQNEIQTLTLYALFDGFKRVIDAQLQVMNTIASELPDVVIAETNSAEFFSIFPEKNFSATCYSITPEKLGEFSNHFKYLSRAYIINENTIMVSIDLNQLNMTESEANSKILELNGKKNYIDPLNTDELIKFGEEFTPSLIEKIRRSFDPKNIYKKIVSSHEKK